MTVEGSAPPPMISAATWYGINAENARLRAFIAGMCCGRDAIPQIPTRACGAPHYGDCLLEQALGIEEPS